VLQFLKENKIVILLFLVFITLYLIAVNRGLELLYVIAGLSLATLIVSLIAPYFNLIGLNVILKYPKYSKQNQKIPLVIELSAPSFFGKYFLEVWLKTPFCTNEEHMFFIKRLHKKLIIKSEISTDVRGVHQLGPIKIETGFPLGLKVFKKIFEDTKGEIVVFPTPLKVKKFSLNRDEVFLLPQDNKSKKKGGHDEFVSLREYKQGDSPRHIHWRSSAKKGELIVKEYCDILSSSLVIVLDLNKKFYVGTSAKETTLEYALTIASSLAIYALDRGYSVSVFGYGKDIMKLIDVQGSHNHLEVLKALAYVKCDGETSYAVAVEYLLGLQTKSGTLVLFDNGSGQVEQNIDGYIMKFFKPILFDIDAESFKKDILEEDFNIEDRQKYRKYSFKKGCDIQRMFT
jgi:uncharacterized protein (DUF58 family)